ncbi:cbb3-type cytochrome c oxidase N-terminal domain-containing protein [Mangrovibacterium diazotrophicum]|uniref:Cbb3-type cytochrome c oxidase subunit III n=1 Tax=Mangrovibacterium diazotrophicum TaxID=1261403 RepID=A0A419W7T0_9BACT|nr:cbb3-type cytochrome c oxidase N-terminal domain-containing protein [Mangrovibacterium diazotrophicum]RKD91412.1 cbb3-type cytochrome c oxidase subunit III [Mangrovibacterium diazotrophicum]
MTTQNKKQQEYDDLTQIKYIGGHDYDGIRELDNRLPPWLKYLFYLSIVFSVSYLMLVFVFEDDSVIQEKEYQKEMAAVHQAEEQEAEAAPVEKKERTREEMVAAGQVTFEKICSVCHGKFGEGLVGPNMTDEYWIHGGSFENMKEVVLNGVIEKGMISYKNQLSNQQIDDVLTYIESLQGTNPPNPKAPQGEKYFPEETTE